MPTRPDTPRDPRRAARASFASGRIAAACLAWWALALVLVSRFPAIETFGIRLTTATLRGLLRLAGLHPELRGDLLSVGRTGVTIAADCSPHLPFLLFAGGVLASPASWPRRAAGLALGALAIHAFNTVRILALMGVIATRPAWFEIAHAYLWQVGTIVAVVAAFALWLPWTAPRPAAA